MKHYLLLFFICCFGAEAIAQSECITAGAIYGSPNSNERGYCVVATTNDDGIYVAGFKDDSILLMEVNLKGIILWSRTFDIVVDAEEHVFSMIIDADGMLAGVGTAGEELLGGTVVAFRFDPTTLQMIWANEYVGELPRDYGEVIVQLEDGNFVIANNAVMLGETNDLELLWLDKSTGNILPGFSRNYHLGGSDRFDDMIFYDHFIYGIGRYTDGDPNSKMRHTLVKIDPTTGNHVWAKLGHVPSNMTARLYGQDIVIDQNEIYTNYYGDPVGTTTTNTKMYIQKSSIDGDLIWLKQYELPGTADACYELIKSGNGFVVFAGKRSAPSDLILFKIDAAGAVLWAKRYPFTNLTSPQVVRDGAAQMTEVGDMLVFTGYVTGDDGTTDLILVRTDLNGETNIPCVEDEDISIPVTAINNPTFYNRNITEFDVSVMEHNKSPEIIATTVSPVCTAIDTQLCGSPSCITMVGPMFTKPGQIMQGYSLAARLENDGFYLGGLLNDSALLIRYDLEGRIIWSRAFDVVQGKANRISAIIVDTDSMIVVSGTTSDVNSGSGGSIFTFRYDPVHHQVLWSKEFVHAASNNFNWTIIEKAPGGNFLLSNISIDNTISNVDAELFEVNRNTGDVAPGIFKKLGLGSSEEITSMLIYEGFLYGAGRFSLDATSASFRHSLIKLDAITGNVVWARAGHLPEEEDARLYGVDLLIANDNIYHLAFGDPEGTNLNSTNLYVQKTNLDGDIQWLKQYELPGVNDWGFDILKSGNGMVILAAQQVLPYDYFLFKIDFEGNVEWAKSFERDFPFFSPRPQIGDYQLIEVGGQLVFTGYEVVAPNESQFFVYRTDLNGNVIVGPCQVYASISIPVHSVESPIFIPVEMIEAEPDFSILTSIKSPHEVVIPYDPNCILSDTLHALTEKSICSGESFEGHTETGIYNSYFTTPAGCDSVHTLSLTVVACEPIVYYSLNACSSFMSTGSQMDYSEFVPEYPTPMSCAEVEATILYRDPPQMNKHSCTPGVNSSVAMCISSLSTCTYLPGNSASLVTEITIDPGDEDVHISKLEFYERSPLNYSWIGGNTGPNNYPKFYGLRVLKNGTVIYQNESIETHQDWTLQTIDFSALPEFNLSEHTVLRMEWLPYCPIGNGAQVSAWDIDEVNLFGACIQAGSEFTSISGEVKSSNGQALNETKLYLSDSKVFDASTETQTDAEGSYLFQQVPKAKKCYLKGENNHDLLLGVNALDLISLKKHLLGIKILSGLPLYVAADINHSGKINVQDLVDLQKVLLGIHAGFPDNKSWRIGNCIRVESQNLQDFEETASVFPVSAASAIVNFQAIKIGDINGDINAIRDSPISKRSQAEFLLEMVQEVKNKTELYVEVRAGQTASMEGIQLFLQSGDVELVNIIPHRIPVTRNDYSVSPEGKVKIIWTDVNELPIHPHDLLFTLVFKLNHQHQASPSITLMNDVRSSEIYEYGQAEKIVLQNETTGTNKIITDVQVIPNPFQSVTMIYFSLHKAENVTFRFFDLSGREFNHQTLFYAPGNQKLEINGLYWPWNLHVAFCQISCDSDLFTVKLIRMP